MESISKAEYYQRLDSHKKTLRALEAMGDFSAVMNNRNDIKQLKLEAQTYYDYLKSLQPGVAVLRSDYRIALNGPRGVAGFIEGNFTNKHVTDIGLQSGPGGVIEIMAHEDQHQRVQISSLDTQEILSAEQARVLEEIVPGATKLSGVPLMEGLNEMTAQNSRHTNSGYKAEVATAGRLTDFVRNEIGRSLTSYYEAGDTSAFYAAVQEAVIHSEVVKVVKEEKELPRNGEGKEEKKEDVGVENIVEKAIERNASTRSDIRGIFEEEQNKNAEQDENKYEGEQVFDLRELNSNFHSLLARAA